MVVAINTTGFSFWFRISASLAMVMKITSRTSIPMTITMSITVTTVGIATMVTINTAGFSLWFGISTSLAMVVNIAPISMTISMSITMTIASIDMSIAMAGFGFGFGIGNSCRFRIWFSTPLAMVMITTIAVPPMISSITSTGFSFSLSFSPRGYEKQGEKGGYKNCSPHAGVA